MQRLLDDLAQRSPARLAGEQLDELLEAANLIREENTGVAGPLRVMVLDGAILVQEQTPQRELLLRTRPSLEEAMEFVDRRLEIYERMWDG
ncbi:MAG TPA: hypothetical protein VLT81_07475 [Chondromyces sp.]|nr:hypothetical protein [Chondromyces sp.]